MKQIPDLEETSGESSSIARLQTEVAELKAQVAALMSHVNVVPFAPERGGADLAREARAGVDAPGPAAEEQAAVPTTRRGMLGKLGAAAAGIAAAGIALKPQTARANTGNALTLGDVSTGAGHNSAEAPTRIVYDGPAATGQSLFLFEDGALSDTAPTDFPAVLNGWASIFGSERGSKRDLWIYRFGNRSRSGRIQ